MKKYHKKTQDAINQIIKYINTPLRNKKISLFFGAGINFNIAKNALSWDDLSSNAMKEYLKSTNKRYSKYETELVSSALIDSIGNNKISLSFPQKYLKLKITPFSKEKNSWFTEGYWKLMSRMNKNIEILTLNYDRVLEQILKRRGINFINESPSSVKEEILHLHGLVNKHDEIVKPSLLTLKDYVDYSGIVEEKLVNHLSKKPKDSSSWSETIIIIGCSLEEEHLLRALKAFSGSKRGLKNVVLITHQPHDKFFFERLKEIYTDLSVELININATNEYKNDFIDFWTLLSKNVEENQWYGGFEELSSREDIIDNDLYFKIKNSLENIKPIKLGEFLKKINWKNRNNPILIRPIYWLENNDKLLTKGSLKEFMFNELDAFPLAWLHMIKKESFINEEVDFLLGVMENESKEYREFGYIQSEYETIAFIEQNLDRVKYKLKKYPQLLSFLIKKTAKNAKSLSRKIKEVISKYYSYEDLLISDKKNVFINFYPTKDTFIFSLFKNMMKNKKSQINSVDDLMRWIENKEGHLLSWEIICHMLLDQYNVFLQKNLDILIKTLDRQEQLKKEYNISTLHRIHTILYFIFIDSERKNEYLKKIKEIDCIFETLPCDIDLLGHGGSTTPNYSIHDGELIKTHDIQLLDDWRGVDEILNKDFCTKKEKVSVMNFLKRKENQTLSIWKKINKHKNINNFKGWLYFSNLETIIFECENWDIYKEFIKYRNIGHNSLVDCKPPFDIFKRETNLITSLKGNFDAKTYVELLKITDIKILEKYYNKRFLFNETIVYIMRAFLEGREVKKTRNILNKLFNSVFKWREDFFIDLIQNKLESKNIDELDFSMKYNKAYKLKKIEKVIQLHGSNDFSDKFFRVADFNIRLQKNREDWNVDYLKLMKYVDNQKLSQEEKQNKEEWYKSFYSKIAYNILEYNTDMKEEYFNFLSLKEVSVAIDAMTKPSKVDERIFRLLENLRNPILELNNFIFAIDRLDLNSLGVKTIGWLFEEIIRLISLNNKEEWFYDMDFIKEFYHKLNLSQKERIKKLFKEKKIEYKL